MENPRPEKVAVVDEVREKLAGADAALLTEYRGLTVKQLAELRRQLRPAGGEYKVYKNTLVRFAAREVVEDRLGLDAHRTDGDHLRPWRPGRRGQDCSATTPRATRPSCSRAACSATRSSRPRTSRRWPTCRRATCCWPSSPEPSRPRWSKLAGLLQALPRNFAYGLKALIDQRGGPEEAAPRRDPRHRTNPHPSPSSEPAAEAPADAAETTADTTVEPAPDQEPQEEE